MELGTQEDSTRTELSVQHCPMFFCWCFFAKFSKKSSGGADLEGEATTFGAKCIPWLQGMLQGFGNGISRPDVERIYGWVNYCASGVVSAARQTFAVEQITTLCHTYPKNFVGIILLPNRANDLRLSPKNLGWYYYDIFLIFF